MTKKNIQVLTGILVFQFVIAFFLFNQEDNLNTFKKTEALLSINFDQTSKMVIEDSEKNSLTFTKDQGEWIMPQYFDFPVSAEKMKEHIEKLKGFKKSWPVGRTAVSAKQFEVTDDKFEKKLTFYQGDKLIQTMFLGTSPSYKKIHTRINDENLIYSIDLNSYDVSTKGKDWQDSSFFAVDEKSITSIEINNLRMTVSNGVMSLSDLGETEEMNQSSARSTLSTLRNPRFDEVVAKDTNDPTGTTFLSYSIETSKEKLTFHLVEYAKPIAAKDKDKEKVEDPNKDFLKLKVSKYPYVFKVRRSQFNDLVKLDRNTLIQEKVVEKKDEKGASSSQDEKKDDHALINNKTTKSTMAQTK